MRANELRLDELIRFEDGVVSLHGRRLILHDLHAFAQFQGGSDYFGWSGQCLAHIDTVRLFHWPGGRGSHGAAVSMG